MRLPHRHSLIIVIIFIVVVVVGHLANWTKKKGKHMKEEREGSLEGIKEGKEGRAKEGIG